MTASGALIPYEIRPSKQLERRMMAELLSIVSHSGANLPNYEYVGLGGFKYIDFMLMNKVVGFSRYASIEKHEELWTRCKFNRPFGHISFHPGSISEFLISSGKVEQNRVWWLDYDLRIDDEMVSDISSICSRMKDGDILFVTTTAEPTLSLRKTKPKERRNQLAESFPTYSQFFLDYENDAYTDASFRFVSAEFAKRVVRSAMSAAVDVVSHPVFDVLYKDSTWMHTFGILASKKHSRLPGKVKLGMRHSMPFLVDTPTFQIPQFNLTERERGLLDKIATSDSEKDWRLMSILGFDTEYLSAYRSMMRFIPRYVESAL